MKEIHGLPDAVLAKDLKVVVDTKLLNSLVYLIGIAEKGLKINLPELKERLNNLKGIKLNSLAYLFNTQLNQSLKSQNVNEVRALIENLKKSKLTSQEIIIDSIQCDKFSSYENDLLMNVFKYGYTTTYKKTPDLKPLKKVEADKNVLVLKEALSYIKLIDINSFQEIQNCVSEIFVYDSKFMNSGSSLNSLGLITLNKLIENQNWTTYLEIIIHEAAHLHLYNIMVIDPLFENNDKLFDSPLRKEKRPMIGIFHGMFVLSRIIRAFNLLDIYFEDKENKPQIVYSYNNSKNIAPHEIKFEDLYQTVIKNAKLTALGERIVNDCYEMSKNSAHNIV